MLYNLISKHIPDNFIRFSNFDSQEAEQLVNALERDWISNGNGLSVPYWANKIGHVELNNLVYALSKSGWVISTVLPRYASFKLNIDRLSVYLDEDKQLTFRKLALINRYKLRHVDEIQENDLVSTPSGIKRTGLERPGFAKSANMSFSFDTNMLLKYYDPILKNCVKSMKKMSKRYPDILDDKANYLDISIDLLEYYLCNPHQKYNMECNISDQRGRAIYSGLKRVFNPISNKDARSLMISDKSVFVTKCNDAQMSDIYLFIAELSGSKSKSWNMKKLSGMHAYNRKFLHELNLKSSKDRKDLHENIWLERIYQKLDEINDIGYTMWDIPLEMDATASIAQIIGVLTNDKRLLDKTNVIQSNSLEDFWRIEGVSNRNGIKAIGTPVGYGSSQSFKKLLKAKNEELTRDEMKLVVKEFRNGAFSTIKNFKDFILTHSKMETKETTINGWNESYIIEVNRFKAVGANLQGYTGYDTAKDRDRIFLIHEPIRIPDYDRFKLFHVTGQIHNLDSNLMDGTMVDLHALGEWAIAIHDAGLVLPGTAMRRSYLNRLELMRKDRHKIMKDYRESIGATGVTADIAWAKLIDSTEQLHGNTQFKESSLK